ncbi:AraC family transcriptional regulator [Pseudoxanthomonas indica]|uniref:AraC-type DNA-binding protein n=1 Tax=Pseudoxanthomonas indica TaxID=428993 RepID=A0A1T5K7N8_9GAMM|nr:AraC family transcriptional regulator [Pseudoxanthomonas indica]GGD47377.1 AraC family transcriptional regulator [Pseudoxanthomonas indica]SKC59717.1 AraC-type DNA-binding protein [Pseudoxanthomonas indica]
MSSKHGNSSTTKPAAAGPAPPSIDRLTPVLERFRVQASLFHSGPLCGHQSFEAVPGRAFMHVLRRGELEVVHHGEQGLQRLHLSQPTLLLFPRAAHHEFFNPPVDGSDFTCATLDFDGGARNPIVQSLPDFIALPLNEIEGLEPALDLLFAESDQNRCGSRLLTNRLFEVVLIQVLRWIIDHPAQAQVSQGLMMGLSDPRLARSLVALHRAPHEEWSLERMAGIAGMSRSAFAAAFKSSTGTTPAAYLLDWKLSVASSMLRSGRSVKQAALDLGFADAPTLSRAFRRRTGSSPREWLAGIFASA